MVNANDKMRPIVVNQHYIPKSYLKNFGFLVNPKKRKWSLYAMINGGEIERRTTESVCAVDYLYDLPFAEGEERQFLEHAYEEHADRHFPIITEFVTDDAQRELSPEMREKILKSCLSLYFRTPKFVALDQQALDAIQLLPENERDHALKVKKQQLLDDSIKNFEALYEANRYSGISINKAVRNWEFISGDNPVIIRDLKNNVQEVFAPGNMIHIPLTPRYLISIMPANEKKLLGKFNRVLYDDDHVMSINHDIERYHQQFLLGTENALKIYLNESPAYKAPVPPHHPKIVQLNLKSQALIKLNSLLEEGSGQITPEVKAYFNWCFDNIPGFKDDPNAIEVKPTIDNS